MEVKRDIREQKLSATVIKESLRDALEISHQLRQMCNDTLSSQTICPSVCQSEVLQKIETMGTSLQKIMEFVNTPLKRTEIVNKLLKVERKKRWKIKKRRLHRVKSAFVRGMLSHRNHQLDTWRKEQERLFGTEVEKERLQTSIYEKETKIQQLLKKRFIVQKLLTSVHALRSLRIKKLRTQGYTDVDDEDSIELGILKTCQGDIDSYKEVSVSKKKSEWQLVSEEKEESDADYYLGAETDINKLIAIRRSWDSYLVPRGRGSRIPTHFVEPPQRPWL